MKEQLDFRVSPKTAFNEEEYAKFIEKEFGENASLYELAKRSIDARKRDVIVLLRFVLKTEKEVWNKGRLQNVANAPEVHIIGSGPAGLFAGIRMIELGLKPIIFERGNDVKERRRDLANINKNHEVNPDSNYCFGEGGAGNLF